MNLNLFKATKTRGLFFKMFLITFVPIIALLLYKKILGGTLKPYYFDILACIITTLWLILTCLFIIKNKINFGNFIGKPSKNRFIFEVPLTLMVTFMGGIGAILIIFFIAYSISPSFFNSVNSNINQEPKIYTTSFSIAVSFIGSVILAPITEEFIFRGILLNRLHNKYGLNKAIILSSLIFMLCHLKPNPLLLFTGISCCILVYKYNSLIPSILLHASNNLLVHLRDLSYSSNTSSSSGFSTNFFIPILGIILLSIYILYIYKNYPKNNLLTIDQTNIQV